MNLKKKNVSVLNMYRGFFLLLLSSFHHVSCSHSFYIVLGFVSNLEMVQYPGEYMQVPSADTCYKIAF